VRSGMRRSFSIELDSTNNQNTAHVGARYFVPLQSSLLPQSQPDDEFFLVGAGNPASTGKDSVQLHSSYVIMI
jgi:hypothetical protein